MTTRRVKCLVTAMVLAAGAGRRLGGESKVWRLFRGRPLWWHAASAFSGAVDAVVLVLAPDRMTEARSWLEDFPVPWELAAGGEERWQSTAAGMAKVTGEFVAIHDGARPLVPPELIRRTLKAAHTTGAAIPAIPVSDTVKLVRDGMVERTLPRSRTMLAQTPQVFRSDWIRRALVEQGGPVTDDASWVEALGYPVAVVAGDPQNRKITTPDDWEWLERQER